MNMQNVRDSHSCKMKVDQDRQTTTSRRTIAMPKLLYCTLFIFLTTLLACSGPETSPSPTAGAQNEALAPAAASIPAPTTDPEEIPAEAPAQAESPIPAGDPTTAPAEEPAPAPTDAPPEITPESGMPGHAGMGFLISELSGDEQSCLSENGDPQQLLMLMNSTELASPEERNAFAGCLENETLLNIFLKKFTDQAGPMSSDTSACVRAEFQNLDLPAMMLTSPEEPEEEAGIVQVMAGLIIVLVCLDETEWQAASQPLDLPPDGREALQCAMKLLGGPEGVVASMESKEGGPTMAFLNAANECGLTIMGGPQG